MIKWRTKKDKDEDQYVIQIDCLKRTIKRLIVDHYKDSYGFLFCALDACTYIEEKLEDKNFAREISRAAGLCEEAVKWRVSENPKDYIDYPIHQIQRLEKKLNNTHNRIDFIEKRIEDLQKKICDLEKELE